MSLNSLHQLNPEMTGGFYTGELTHAEVLARALDPNYILDRVRKNAGWTAFDEATVQIGWIRGKGNCSVSANLVGYRGPMAARINAMKIRIRNMGPHKLRAMHTSIKLHGLVPPIGSGIHAAAGGGRHPLFYTFERLLQLWFHDYIAEYIPQRIRNWVPAEESYWYHWWFEREEFIND